jgi:hypothetical protein
MCPIGSGCSFEISSWIRADKLRGIPIFGASLLVVLLRDEIGYYESTDYDAGHS